MGGCQAWVVWGNYLRVRGEYLSNNNIRLTSTELPPRTRRIRIFSMCWPRGGGTTSAYAENTRRGPLGRRCFRNYLRVRGEYLGRLHAHVGVRGTTSAYAENTGPVCRANLSDGNYLRVRGEYWFSQRASICQRELPPRTRRIPRATPPHARTTGTTSAYAENTLPISVLSRFIWELPPRTRRIPIANIIRSSENRTTSAYAENTFPSMWRRKKHWNYLRVRGEYAQCTTALRQAMELPPRTRRIRHRFITERIIGGTTSAYAENTLNELGLL